jgi:hypothetical protein
MRTRMSEVMLAIDSVLEAIIGPSPGSIDEIIRKAREGEIQLILEDFALYCALASVREGDKVNIRRLADLIKYAQIQLDSPEFLGSLDRESWTPSNEAIENWRRWALQES